MSRRRLFWSYFYTMTIHTATWTLPMCCIPLDDSLLPHRLLFESKTVMVIVHMRRRIVFFVYYVYHNAMLYSLVEEVFCTQTRLLC